MGFRHQNIRAPEENACTAGLVNLGLRIRMGQERLSPGETSQAKRSEEKRLFSIQKLSLKYIFFLVDGQKAKKLQMSHDKKDGK